LAFQGRWAVARRIPEIDREIETRVTAMEMEVVEIAWAGSDRRPILRIRVDFPDSVPGRGVSVADCARVSRGLEPWLDEHALLPEKYTVEVSSPGVERPLHRRRDFERFAGEEVAVSGSSPLVEGGPTRLEGRLEGVGEGGDMEEYHVRIRRRDGEVVAVPRALIEKARLVFRWDGEG
jgi:ribosome maturation factor RimP